MGFYIPKKSSKRLSIKEALIQAENDHYLDCPNADISTRIAAFILDIILIVLIVTTIQKFFSAISAYTVFFLGGGEHYYKKLIATMFAVVEIGMKISAFYFYTAWSVATFGGTAGKLLLGLRIVSITTGGAPSLFFATIRETLAKLLSIISIIGILLPLISKDGRFLHDFITLTIVKKTRGVK